MRRLALLLCLGLLSCGKKDPTPAPDASVSPVPVPVPVPDPDKKSESSPSNQLGMMAALFAAQSEQPGPYDAPKQSPNFTADSAHWVIAELDGSVVELEAMSLFGATGHELRKLSETLRGLAADTKVSGLLLRVDSPSMTFSTAEELRDILLAWKSRKGASKLLCHVESSDTVVTYLLTACDAVGLAPGGSMEYVGVAATPLHVKGLLDKVKVKADFLHIGAFKGAAEPLTLDRPSKESTETLEAILDGLYGSLVAALTDKKLTPEAAKALIDEGFFFDQQAVKAGLATDIATFEEFRDKQLAGAAWSVQPLGRKPAKDLGGIMDLLGLTPKPRPTAPHVALVYAVGNVVDDPDGGVLGTREQIGSRPLANALRALARDESVKAVVLRIDSPGGSALASELIFRATKELVAAKPLIVSMSTLAASGGYYIAAAATRIYARKNTFTGSIGVVGGKLVFGEALKSFGINVFPLKRGAMSTAFLPLEVWSKEERARVEQHMLGVYDMFTTHVAEGRKKNRDDILKVAQGRVWLGQTALQHGLVDEIGGLEAALAQARKLAGVDETVALEVYPADPTLMDFVKEFTGGSASLGALVGTLGLPKQLVAASQTQLQAVLSFATTPVQTSLWLPVAFLGIGQ